jgi:hypothetical protein
MHKPQPSITTARLPGERDQASRPAGALSPLSLNRACFVSLMLLCALLLSGCASVIRSEVTVFHEWPAEAGQRSYAFVELPGDENNLELRSYQTLVRQELGRVGFTEAATLESAVYKVGMEYSNEVREKRILQTVPMDPFYGSPWAPIYGPGWSRGGFYGHGMYYDPFWYAPPQVVERTVEVFHRTLRVPISRQADDRLLYDVTVVSEGVTQSLPAVMPYLVRSAFADFPGKSGAPRVVDLKMEK